MHTVRTSHYSLPMQQASFLNIAEVEIGGHRLVDTLDPYLVLT